MRHQLNIYLQIDGLKWNVSEMCLKCLKCVSKSRQSHKHRCMLVQLCVRIHKCFKWLSPQWCSQRQLRPHTHTNGYLEPHSWDHTGRHTDTGVCCRSLCQLCRAEGMSSSSPLPEVSLDTTLLWHHTHYHTLAVIVSLFALTLFMAPCKKKKKKRQMFRVVIKCLFANSSLFSVWRRVKSEWVVRQTFATQVAR